MSGYAAQQPPTITTTFFGITGDECDTCQSTTTPLYGRFCHDSFLYHCQDCLTKAWYGSAGDIVPCPLSGEDCGFMPVPGCEECFNNLTFDDVDFLSNSTQGQAYMNHSIAFTATEAEMLLEELFRSTEWQGDDVQELGGMGGFQPSFDDQISQNPIYMDILHQMTEVSKMMTTPPQLHEDLLQVLNNNMLRHVADDFEPLKQIHANWIKLIKEYVDLLAFIHLERLTPRATDLEGL